MNAQGSPQTEVASRREAVRGPEIGPALKRDRLLQKVRAARQRLTAAPGTVARLR